MECAISGKEPLEPVVSRAGYVFEKSLIEKYLEQHSTCPVTDEPMNMEELIPLKVKPSIPPRPTSGSSVPQLMQLLQNEWDAAMLETYSLRKQLETTRYELATALYKYDAATRVIARLMRERDEARAELVDTRVVGAGNGDAMDTVSDELSADLITKISNNANTLQQDRKNRKDQSISVNDILSFKQTASRSIHKTTHPGVLCVDINAANSDLIVTGGNDKTAVVFNKESKKKVATLVGHSKPVTHVAFHSTEDAIVTGSQDRTVRLWQGNNGKYTGRHQFKLHTGVITGVKIHPLGTHLVTSSEDRSWAFHDLVNGQSLIRPLGDQPITCMDVHPDNVIVGTGQSDGQVCIWDIRSQKVAARFGSHQGGVRDMNFSESGFQLVTASSNTVELWDLRVCKAEAVHNSSSNVNSIHCSYSGKYIAVGKDDLTVLNAKDMEVVKSFTDHTQAVTGVKWARDEQFIATASLDRSLKLFSA